MKDDIGSGYSTAVRMLLFELGDGDIDFWIDTFLNAGLH